MKKRMKSSIIVFAAMLVAVSAFFMGIKLMPKAQAAEREVIASGSYSNVNWNLYDDGELYIGGEGQLPGNSWSEYKSSINKITIGKKITLYNTSFRIKSYEYPNLESISVEEGNSYFSTDENGVLYNYSKTELYLFPSASNIKEYTIPDNVITIKNYAFSGGKNLETIVFGEKTKTIESYAFFNNLKLSNAVFSNGLQTIAANAFSGCESLTEISIPDSVKEIGSTAFNGCSGIVNLFLGTGIQSIGSKAFNCSSLENVYYNGDITSWCNIEFTIKDSNPLYYADNFYIDNKLVTDFIVPEGIKEIPDYLFCNYKKLTGVSFSETVRNIGTYAFSGTGLTEIIIPEGIARIGQNAFRSCSNLSSISTPDSLTFIGADAFLDTAFYNDYANWDSGFLYLNDNLIAADSKKVASECRIFPKTRLIAANTFDRFFNITDVIMADNVEYINDSAFANCVYLKSIYLSKGLKEIGNSAFQGDKCITEIEIPDGVISIGNNAFESCTGLKGIEIPSSVKYIEYRAFLNCNNLETVILNEGLTKIGATAFKGTEKLSSIEIPGSVTDLASDAFNLSGISVIYFGGSKADWKRATKDGDFSNFEIYYTLKNDDDSVEIVFSDSNFEWYSGNVHIVSVELDKFSSTYENNGYYHRMLASPLQIMDIKLVDGDGNDIQPLEGQLITVRIKATEEFMELLKAGLSSQGEYEVEASDIDFIDDCFVFEQSGEILTVPASEYFLQTFKIIHWHSDADDPREHEAILHDRITVKDGFINIKSSHFSEFAVCTDLIEFESAETSLKNGESITVPYVAKDGTDVLFKSSDENIATVDENGVFYAKNPGTAEITATVSGTNISCSCKVTVTPRNFTVKWDIDGAIVEQTLGEQTALTPPTETEKEGYTFVGWTPAVPKTMPACDVTFRAVYEKIEATEIRIVKLPNKTNYTYKVDSLDLDGIVIEVTYSDGSKETVSDTSRIKADGFSSKKVGTESIAVEYENCTAKFDITVSYAWWQRIIRILLLGFLWY